MRENTPKIPPEAAGGGPRARGILGGFKRETPGTTARSTPSPTPSPQRRAAGSAAGHRQRGGGSEGTGPPSASHTARREVKAGPGRAVKVGNTFLLPPELFPLVAGVHGGVAGSGFKLQVPQAHEGVEKTPRQSRALPTPRVAA